MLLSALKIIFLISTVVFSLLIIIHKQFTLKVKDNIKISNYVAIMAFCLVTYIICAILLGFMLDDIKYKFLMMLFALSPFIIGKIATYGKIKLFSSLQIIVMLISIAVTCLK